MKISVGDIVLYTFHSDDLCQGMKYKAGMTRPAVVIKIVNEGCGNYDRDHVPQELYNLIVLCEDTSFKTVESAIFLKNNIRFDPQGDDGTCKTIKKETTEPSIPSKTVPAESPATIVPKQSEERSFKVGDIVQLKSGGGVMVIESILSECDEDQSVKTFYKCVWHTRDFLSCCNHYSCDVLNKVASFPPYTYLKG